MKVWFQNRRTKHKRQKTDDDDPNAEDGSDGRHSDTECANKRDRSPNNTFGRRMSKDSDMDEEDEIEDEESENESVPDLHNYPWINYSSYPNIQNNDPTHVH